MTDNSIPAADVRKHQQCPAGSKFHSRVFASTPKVEEVRLIFPTGNYCRVLEMRSSLLQVAIAALAGLATGTVVTDNPASVANKTFDFVIVGAGLSGITVGNKVCFRRMVNSAGAGCRANLN